MVTALANALGITNPHPGGVAGMNVGPFVRLLTQHEIQARYQGRTVDHLVADIVGAMQQLGQW